MKFEAPKTPFLNALQMAGSAIPNKTTLQILYNFLLRLKGDRLEITATDLDLTIALAMEVQGHQDGEIVINAKKLLEVVRELPEFPVLVSVEDYVVNIKSESGFQCNLTGFDAGEYPGLPELDGDAAAGEARLKDLKFLSDKTSFAVSTDFSRLSLTGVYWEIKDDRMQMAATDGHRLGKAWIPLAGPKFKAGVILPPRALSQVLDMAEDEERPIAVRIGPATARFATDNITLYTKLIEGPYPNYENVIPKEFSKRLQAGREQLAGVLRRVATMANAKTRMVVFNFQEGQLTLSAKNPDLGGESEESLPVAYQGESLELGVNANYMLEVLRLTHTEEVVLRFNSPLGAVIVAPAEAEGTEAAPGYFFIVMPLRIIKEAS